MHLIIESCGKHHTPGSVQRGCPRHLYLLSGQFLLAAEATLGTKLMVVTLDNWFIFVHGVHDIMVCLVAGIKRTNSTCIEVLGLVSHTTLPLHPVPHRY